MDEIYVFLKKCKTYYLATIDGDKPKVRPFGTIDKFEDKLYIQTGKKKDVSKQIHKNPNVEICAFYEGRWIRVSATLIPDERIEAKKHMLDAYPELRHMYDEKDANTEVFYLQDVSGGIYSFSEKPKLFKF